MASGPLHRFGGPLFVHIELMATKIKRPLRLHRQRRNTRLISATGHISRDMPFHSSAMPVASRNTSPTIAAHNNARQWAHTQKTAAFLREKCPPDVVSSICRPIRMDRFFVGRFFACVCHSFRSLNILFGWILKVCSVSTSSRRRPLSSVRPYMGNGSNGFMMRQWQHHCFASFYLHQTVRK